MYYTNEYTVLKSNNGGEDITIKPGTKNSFEAFEGDYTATSSAQIIDVNTKKIVAIWNGGDKITGIGEVKKSVAKKVKQAVKESLLETNDG